MRSLSKTNLSVKIIFISNRYDVTPHISDQIKRFTVTSNPPSCDFLSYADKRHSPPFFRLLFRGGAWHPDFTEPDCWRRRRRRENRDQRTLARFWNAARGGNLTRRLQGRNQLTNPTNRQWSTDPHEKMNYFILLSVLATVVTGKSPRLKFIVHGKTFILDRFGDSAW